MKCPNRPLTVVSLLLAVAVVQPLLPATAWAGGSTFNVRQYGAVGDGTKLDTAALQQAIDAAAGAGGGTVLLPPGKYLSGSLHLKSHVELHLDLGATLLGSTARPDYQKVRWYALLLASKQEDIKISGEGTIDGQGLLLAQDVIRRVASGELPKQSRNDRPDENERPLVIEFSDCRGVAVSGVTLRNASGWLENYIRCEDLVVQGIKVDNHVYPNNDGIDITDCRNVRITKCDFNCQDDGVCLKSGANGKCYNVDVSDCRIRSSASAFKLGTASRGGFQKIHATNLFIYDTLRTAIALECVDGGVLKDVLVENVVATNTGGAIFIRLGRREINAPAGQLQDIIIRNIKVQVPAGKPDAGYVIAGPTITWPHNVFPSSIVGLPGSLVRNVRLENIEIIHPGGGSASVACVPVDKLNKVPENAEKYPEFSMFKELPAWGFYIRHAEGIQFINVRLVRQSSDYRPALVCDDVRNLELNGFHAESAGSEPVLVLNDVNGAELRNSPPPPGTTRFLKTTGSTQNLKGF